MISSITPNGEVGVDSTTSMELRSSATGGHHATVKPNERTRSIVITFHEYQRDNIEFKQYKLPELKQMAKYNKLTQSGTKATLVQKLDRFFKTHLAARTIQKMVRGRFVHLCFHLHYRGNAFVDRTLCVNETDFFTMEPLNNIPFQQFFSYTDNHAFTYGFDIQSLILLHRAKEKLINPYNRVAFPEDVASKIMILYQLIRIVFPECIISGDVYVSPFHRSRRPRARRQQLTRQPAPNENTIVLHNDPSFAWTRYQMTTITLLSTGFPPLFLVELMIQLEAKKRMMIQLKQKSTISRIQELFMEMDQLGNYTDSSWMLNLQVPSLHALYRHLVDIWRIRAQIPDEVRHHICPVEDPFLMLEPRNDEDIENARRHCLGSMENLVFSGLDIEYRKLGAMHVLTALTMVSIPARNSFFWLYETMA